MFYISSRGHSATGWLSHQISQHKKVVCWHGTRSIPPADPGINDLSPKRFVDGLKICENQRDNRIYGAIHGYHGTIIKDGIESKGGKFAGVFRDPISKISSFFHAYLWSNISGGVLPGDFNGPTKKLLEKLSEEKILKFFENKKGEKQNNRINKFLSSYLRKVKKEKIRSKYYNKSQNYIIEEILNSDNNEIISDLFFSICKQTFFYDYEIFSKCNKEQYLIMEKFVRDKDYFVNNLWNYLIPSLKDKAELNGFNNKFKPHNPNIQQNSNEKFEFFPKQFQELLKWFFKNQDEGLKNLYKQNNYLIIT